MRAVAKIRCTSMPVLPVACDLMREAACAHKDVRASFNECLLRRSLPAQRGPYRVSRPTAGSECEPPHAKTSAERDTETHAEAQRDAAIEIPPPRPGTLPPSARTISGPFGTRACPYFGVSFIKLPGEQQSLFIQ